MKRIWIITVGEPLPTDGTSSRLLRSGILAEHLAAAGWDVVWWTSDFDHTQKRHRAGRDELVEYKPNLRIWLLHAPGYRRNISFARIRNHIGVAKKFAEIAPTQPEPDVILCSLPTVELSLAATKYANERGIPIALDARDKWPDIFVELAPRPLRPLARLALGPAFRDLRKACREATALIGHSSRYVDWALAAAGRARTPLDRDFPFGYTAKQPPPELIAGAEGYWLAHGIGPRHGRFIASFFGTLGRQFDIDTVIEAARKLAGGPRPFLFIVCGEGDRAAHYREVARDVPNILFPGWVEAHHIWTLMRRSAVGLAPYYPLDNFIDACQNKVIEYLSAGLPVLSSLPGVTEELLRDGDCGITYPAGDADALAAAMIRLHDDADLRARMSRNAESYYRTHFVAEVVYDGLRKHLETLAGTRVK